jgi:hypothetical protein
MWHPGTVVVELPVVVPGVAIYEHIRTHVEPSGRLPDEVGLPDDEKLTAGQFRWAPGAMDGVFGHHSSTDAAARAVEVAGLLGAACRHPTVRNLRTLYAAVADDDVVSYVDALVETITREPPDRQALHTIGRWLATTAPDRGPVKLGIALLGFTGLGPDVAVVRTLGTHEEFTLYCAVAIANGLADHESELWALAASVDGWGRIQCVARLRDTADPDIRAWLLREGFRNSIMYEYLAHLAATTGGLVAALRGTVDRGLLTAAGEILTALANGGPAEDMDDYDDGAEAVEVFLTLMHTRAETLTDFLSVLAIHTYLTTDGDWDTRATHGWTATRREAFEDACTEILHRAEWLDRITIALASPDALEFHVATVAAQARGMDTFDVHVAKIKADPYDAGWFHAWAQADGERAHLLVDLARTLLPIDEITTGADNELGLDPRWRPHTALDWTLRALRHHPGLGGDLLLAALRSPVTRNRNMALQALEQWPRPTWPAGTHEALTTVAITDPNDRTRLTAQALCEQ